MTHGFVFIRTTGGSAVTVQWLHLDPEQLCNNTGQDLSGSGRWTALLPCSMSKDTVNVSVSCWANSPPSGAGLRSAGWRHLIYRVKLWTVTTINSAVDENTLRFMRIKFTGIELYRWILLWDFSGKSVNFHFLWISKWFFKSWNTEMVRILQYRSRWKYVSSGINVMSNNFSLGPNEVPQL